MKIEPVILAGEFVKLEPLQREHFENLCEVGLEESLWRWTGNVIESREDLQRYVETAFEEFERKISLPFVSGNLFSRISYAPYASR